MLEPALLASGIHHWEYHRFELYRVNPPLVRLIAAMPVVAVGCNTDWRRFSDHPNDRSEFAVGEDFIAANGRRSIWLFTLARWMCIPFSLLGAVVAWQWTRERTNSNFAGIIAAAVWCFEPNILAHGELITNDTAAASLGLSSGYAFWRWLKCHTQLDAAGAGVCLALSVLAKSSWSFLFILWPVLWAIHSWHCRRREVRPAKKHTIEFNPSKDAIGEKLLARPSGNLRQMVSILLIAIFVLNAGYCFDGSFRRLDTYLFTSRALTGRDAVEEHGNRFKGTWLQWLLVPLPAQFILGLDAQKRDFEKFHKPSYLNGEWSNNGWWYYYIYCSAVKIPIGLQVLFVIAAAHTFIRMFTFVGSKKDSVCRNERGDLLSLLAPAICLFVLVSSQTGLNAHFRYVLPCFGFCIVFIVSGIHELDIRFRRHIIAYRLFIATMLFWALESSVVVYPHSLTYFNELAGGPAKGHLHLLGSNLNWGQDLLFLRELQEQKVLSAATILIPCTYNPADIGVSIWSTQSALQAKPSEVLTRRLYSRPVITTHEILHGSPDAIPIGNGDYRILTQSELEFLGNNVDDFRRIPNCGNLLLIR